MSGIKYIEGDLFKEMNDYQGNQPIIIPHVVNSHGVFGSGFVIPLTKAYPEVRNKYLQWHKEGSCKSKYKNSAGNLVEYQIDFDYGETQYVTVVYTDPKVIVANMLAQDLGGIRPLMYNHLATCMDSVAKMAVELNAKIMCPMFGSQLAGGNWDFIKELIEDCWLEHDIDVNVFYLPGKTPEGWSPPKE